MPMDLLSIYDKSNQVIAKKLEDEFIIVPIKKKDPNFSDELYSLNETGRELWEYIDGKINLKQLIEIIEKEYKTAAREQIQRDVIDLIQDLLHHQIIIRIQ